MGDVVGFGDRIARAMGEDQGAGFELFLIEEGLELLAAYRSLRDPVLRDSIMTLIKAIAVTQPTLAVEV